MNGGVPNTIARVGLWGSKETATFLSDESQFSMLTAEPLPRTGRIKGCKQTLGMTGALLESQPPRIEELGREDRCSSTTSISTSTSTASISTRSPPLYYGANPLGPGDDRRMNTQPLHKKSNSKKSHRPLQETTGTRINLLIERLPIGPVCATRLASAPYDWVKPTVRREHVREGGTNT
ncbi:ndt80 like dna-binding family protein [Colletotrichum musicola]|uniref:Ndt80 like dna-binding family protein n=1 Tax=Colletotrichum musicola TaxID=2175873 RepID=A0A8H6U6A9_9PEZI|nr:ndt80 like dna-binding family protein [Colletotrichum musicola]